jgi:hypothetical protein
LDSSEHFAVLESFGLTKMEVALIHSKERLLDSAQRERGKKKMIAHQSFIRNLGTVFVHSEPPDVTCHSGKAHISTNHNITEEEPAIHDSLVLVPRRLLHDVLIGGVKAKSGGWETISDEVDPEELNRNKGLRSTENNSKENAVERVWGSVRIKYIGKRTIKEGRED